MVSAGNPKRKAGWVALMPKAKGKAEAEIRPSHIMIANSIYSARRRRGLTLALGVQVGQLFGETTSEDAILVVRGDERIDMKTDEQPGMGLLQVILPASNRAA
ncbi:MULTISPECIES: hypothetical protein [unclassified Sphingomonas]|uniref:hypothetical protein n=1 Tax=unclassified Sphingomonas TaxID=196159 RepID=UPI0006F37359|nr:MULTISPECIES: hypothetical protein [unclassified Sphingomonas]KQX23471.1 hypothetical protein ASD17_04015 [Sphingomonas sp. Root1294]KQY68321.1 hypothetical protein ASD39_06535 [Sphingomonas sp. Root50]KRB91221.1 hypothetical protein ASE22_13340 [Sphingomonas sp. Root720]